MYEKIAFTMAEILLSLTIIGVVAAITLPSLMGNINERTWNTQRKALHARMSQAIAMMPNLNGFGTYIADTKDAAGSVTSSGTDTVAEAFLTEGLSKVLKINNICDHEHLKDCGIPDTINDFTGREAYSSIPDTILKFNDNWIGVNVDVPNAKAAAFETQNGESILLYYNPNCISKSEFSHAGDDLVCANFVYDLNGNKGPNTVGKDIGFITAFYPTDSDVVAPNIASGIIPTESWLDASGACTAFDNSTRVPNINEAISLVLNYKLTAVDGEIMSNTRADLNNYYMIRLASPQIFVEPVPFDGLGSLYCIKR